MMLIAGDLTLRPVADDDFDDLARLYGDARVAEHMRFGVLDAAGVRELLADYHDCWAKNQFGMWTARRTADQAYVGETGLRLHHRTDGPALRYATAPDSWGQGHASKMAAAVLKDGFERCGLAHIDAFMQDGNQSSRKIAEWIGMFLVNESEVENIKLLQFRAERQNWLAGDGVGGT